MSGDGMTMRLTSALYVEAMVLADEARSYFDDRGRTERATLEPIARVTFTCESLKVTTRLMHIIAWLLTRRALDAGEISHCAARDPSRRLGRIADAEARDIACLPEAARVLVAASDDLYRRICRLDAELTCATRAPSPARSLMARLESAF